MQQHAPPRRHLFKIDHRRFWWPPLPLQTLSLLFPPLMSNAGGKRKGVFPPSCRPEYSHTHTHTHTRLPLPDMERISPPYIFLQQIYMFSPEGIKVRVYLLVFQRLIGRKWRHFRFFAAIGKGSACVGGQKGFSLSFSSSSFASQGDDLSIIHLSRTVLRERKRRRKEGEGSFTFQKGQERRERRRRGLSEEDYAGR